MHVGALPTSRDEAPRLAAAPPLRGVLKVESCKACLALPHFGQATFSLCERTIFS
jgi:hypothetical protein